MKILNHWAAREVTLVYFIVSLVPQTPLASWALRGHVAMASGGVAAGAVVSDRTQWVPWKCWPTPSHGTGGTAGASSPSDTVIPEGLGVEVTPDQGSEPPASLWLPPTPT